MRIGRGGELKHTVNPRVVLRKAAILSGSFNRKHETTVDGSVTNRAPASRLRPPRLTRSQVNKEGPTITLVAVAHVVVEYLNFCNGIDY